MSGDKPTAADRSAGAQPGCKCAVHCAHVHGDQAEDEEGRELLRLRAQYDEAHQYLAVATRNLKASNIEIDRLRQAIRAAFVEPVSIQSIVPESVETAVAQNVEQEREACAAAAAPVPDDGSEPLSEDYLTGYRDGREDAQLAILERSRS